MSVRAYRINRIERADVATFNCWHDSKLMDFLLEDAWHSNTDDEVRQFEVHTDRIEQAIEMIKRGAFDSDYKDNADPIEKIRDILIESLEQDLEFAKAQGDEFVMYDCF